MDTDKAIKTLRNVQTIITSHYASLRQEKQGIKQYTKSDILGRIEVLKLQKTDLESLLVGEEDSTALQDAVIYEAYNNVLGILRSLRNIRALNTRSSLDKLEYDRDIVDLRSRLVKTVFLDEQTDQSRAVPDFLVEEQ
jgi:hypothetical protein